MLRASRAKNLVRTNDSNILSAFGISLRDRRSALRGTIQPTPNDAGDCHQESDRNDDCHKESKKEKACDEKERHDRNDEKQEDDRAEFGWLEGDGRRGSMDIDGRRELHGKVQDRAGFVSRRIDLKIRAKLSAQFAR